jgi:hypothetical protein
MTYQRLPYDDPSGSSQMTSDCRAVEAALALPRRPGRAERTTRAAAGPAPSLRFEDRPREVPKPEIRISEAAARLAAAYHQD